MENITESSAAHQNEIILTLLNLEQLKPSEEINEGRVVYLEERIREAGAWLRPVLVSRPHNIIMDGNHRLEVAKKLSLRRIPCVMVAYGNPKLNVHSWSTNKTLEGKNIISYINGGNVFGYKTARHRLAERIIDIEFPLDSLK